MNETDDPLGPMASALHDLNVREVAACRRLAEIEAEREDLERDILRQRADLDQREALARAAMQECQQARGKAMDLARMLGSVARPTPKAEPTAPSPAPKATPKREPTGPKRGRGRPPKNRADDANDPGGPPPLGVERDAPPDDDELRGEEDL
jgi:hypothetical protein